MQVNYDCNLSEPLQLGGLELTWYSSVDLYAGPGTEPVGFHCRVAYR